MNTEAFKIREEASYMSVLKLVHRKESLLKFLVSKEAQIAVIGLGYVGLPLALHMASKFSVIGFDVNQQKVKSLKKGIDPCEEVAKEDFHKKDIHFHDNHKVLKKANVFIVAVPTPVDANKEPNLNPIKNATISVAKALKAGDIVIFESTVYPGCTEEVCVPILEAYSGLTFNEDFTVGYSPERINPGDSKNTFATIKKIVSGSTSEALEVIAGIYENVVTAGIHRAPSIKVAEAAKVVENTQRDINIALMNELTYIFEKSGISINDVLAAAGTKWNFLNFFPGLVGGHCIGVDPYYLIHKAKQLGVASPLIQSSRNTNEKMVTHLMKKVIHQLAKVKKSNEEINVLIKGITFKENVKDVRNSKVADLIKKLQFLGYNIIIEDPYAEKTAVKNIYQLTLTDKVKADKLKYDAIVMAVNHTAYHQQEIEHLLTEEGFVLDIRGTFKSKVTAHSYLTI